MNDVEFDDFKERVMVDAEVLTLWLTKQFSCDAAAIFFLCAVLQGLIRAGTTEERQRPAEFNRLLTTLDATAKMLGPFVGLLEAQGAESIQ